MGSLDSIGKGVTHAVNQVKQNAGGIAGFASGNIVNGLTGMAYDKIGKDALQKQASNRAAAGKDAQQRADAKAYVDAGGGFSAAKNDSMKYIAENGINQDTANFQTIDTYNNKFNPLMDKAAQLGAQDANVDPAFRQYQLGLANQLQAQAMGQGPSLAQMQLKQATDRTLQQSMGMINAGLGSNPALAARTAALAGSQQLGQYGAQSGITALQQQQWAQSQLAGLSAQGRASDNQVALANQNNRMSGLAYQGQFAQNALAGFGQVQAGRLGQAAQQQTIDAAKDAANRAQQNQIYGSAANAAATLGAAAIGGPAAAAVVNQGVSQAMPTDSSGQAGPYAETPAPVEQSGFNPDKFRTY